MSSLCRLATCATAELGRSSTSPQCHSSRSPPTPPPRCARRRPSPPTGGRVEPAVPSFRTRTAICDCPAPQGGREQTELAANADFNSPEHAVADDDGLGGRSMVLLLEQCLNGL